MYLTTTVNYSHHHLHTSLSHTLTYMLYGNPCCSESSIFFKLHTCNKFRFLNPHSLLINFTVRLKKKRLNNICFYTHDLKMVTICFSLFYDYEKRERKIEFWARFNKCTCGDEQKGHYGVSDTNKHIVRHNFNVYPFNINQHFLIFIEKFCLFFNCLLK